MIPCIYSPASGSSDWDTCDAAIIPISYDVLDFFVDCIDKADDMFGMAKLLSKTTYVLSSVEVFYLKDGCGSLEEFGCLNDDGDLSQGVVVLSESQLESLTGGLSVIDQNVVANQFCVYRAFEGLYIESPAEDSSDSFWVEGISRDLLIEAYHLVSNNNQF